MVYTVTGLAGVKGEGMMELEPSEPLLEAYGTEEEDCNEEDEDEEMVTVAMAAI